MLVKNNNTLNADDSSDVTTSTRPGEVCVLDTEEDQPCLASIEGMNADFASGLRLLSFSDKIIQPFEKKFIIDALSLNLSDYTHEQKMALAHILPKAGTIACSLADMLLLDSEPDIQKHLLQNYAYHSGKALISLAARADDDVLLYMSERAGLKKQIVGALLKRQNKDVTRTVLENKSAECDVSIIRGLIQAGVSDEGACLALLELPNMEPALALDLFWSAPTRPRISILRRFLKSHVLVERHFARLSGPHLRVLPLFSAIGPESIIVDSVGQGLETALDYFVKEQQGNALRLISLCASLPLPLLHKIFGDGGGETVSVLLKALGLGRRQSQHFLGVLSKTQIAKQWPAPERLIEISDMISWGEARMAVSYWLWQTERLGPYQAADDDRFFENISSIDDSEDIGFEAGFGE